ncbi:tRNA (adenosine(37)-N6)-threonylcarbamoyltransferase complex dimerization subunit type 1 TsaB [Clostridiaceae bacterium M8S5]|nr:tRNA (adenosine(37)-N6)-threonylcarbamoyltransferase complex dimerization subunit type 1 TsaB [Clostridiaceae bacterium M8S5]
MKILAVDTSSIVASVALIDDDKLLCEYTVNYKRTHSETILPMIKEVLDSCQLKTGDIDVFAVSIGPGSFTGLRIGVATIKALAHSVDKPVVGIPSMDSMAYNMFNCNSLIVPMMDARRDRVYTGIYTWRDNKFEVIKAQDVIEIEQILDDLRDRDEEVIISGDGGVAYRDIIKEKLGEKVVFSSAYVNMAKASSLAQMALERAKNNQLESYYDLVPEYLRKSQAEREYEEKNR